LPLGASTRGETQCAFLARLTVYPRAAAHHFHNFHRKRESQARSAKTPSHRAVRLSESTKDDLLLIAWYANAGVGNGEVQDDMLFVRRVNAGTHNHFTLGSKFQSVAD